MGDLEFRRIAEAGWHSPVFVGARKMELLTAREKLAGQLEDFRHAMAALAADIEELPWSKLIQRIPECRTGCSALGHRADGHYLDRA